MYGVDFKFNSGKERAIFRYRDGNENKEFLISERTFIKNSLKDAEKEILPSRIDSVFGKEIVETEKVIKDHPLLNDDVKKIKLLEIKTQEFIKGLKLNIKNRLIFKKQKEIGCNKFKKFIMKIEKNCLEFFNEIKDMEV